MRHAIVTTAERPDLAPLTGRWRWEAFRQEEDDSLAEMMAAQAAGAAGPGPMPRTFVLLDDDEPVGMASLPRRCRPLPRMQTPDFWLSVISEILAKLPSSICKSSTVFRCKQRLDRVEACDAGAFP